MFAFGVSRINPFGDHLFHSDDRRKACPPLLAHSCEKLVAFSRNRLFQSTHGMGSNWWWWRLVQSSHDFWYGRSMINPIWSHLGQLPVLKIGDYTLAQSLAIGRYLSRRAKLQGEDDLEIAKNDLLGKQYCCCFVCLIWDSSAIWWLFGNAVKVFTIETSLTYHLERTTPQTVKRQWTLCSKKLSHKAWSNWKLWWVPQPPSIMVPRYQWIILIDIDRQDLDRRFGNFCCVGLFSCSSKGRLAKLPKTSPFVSNDCRKRSGQGFGWRC